MARRGEKINKFRVLMGKGERKRSLDELGPDGKLMFKRILKKWNGRTLTGF